VGSPSEKQPASVDGAETVDGAEAVEAVEAEGGDEVVADWDVEVVRAMLMMDAADA
jgi:hypothetical protein